MRESIPQPSKKKKFSIEDKLAKHPILLEHVEEIGEKILIALKSVGAKGMATKDLQLATIGPDMVGTVAGVDPEWDVTTEPHPAEKFTFEPGHETENFADACRLLEERGMIKNVQKKWMLAV